MTSLYQRDMRSLAAIQRLRFFPLAATRGEGCWLIEEGGRRLLDLSASWASAPLGYGHRAVRAAVTSALAGMAGSSGISVANLPAVALAEELLATLPEPLSAGSVYLGHAGSDANTAVIRAARQFSGRPGVLSFADSYHGGLGEAQAASGFAAGSSQGGYSFLPFPHEASAEQVLARAETALADGTVALVLIEPILSDGGVRVPPEGFLAALSGLCAKAGTLLAADEVKAGLGRTGVLHAFTAENLVPDVLVLGKGLGGGLPLAAAIAPQPVFDAAPGALILTTGANPVCAAAGRAVLATLTGEKLNENAQRVGDRLKRALLGLARRYPVIKEVRGRGLMLGLQIDGAQTPLDAKAFTAMLVYRCWELGAVMYPVGADSDVVELTPPLVLTPQEADTGVEIIRQGLDDVLAGRVPASVTAAFAGW